MRIFRKKVQFRNFFMMPIISVLGRSGYAHDAYFKEELWKYLGNYIYVGSINKYFFYTNRATLYFGEKNMPTLSIPTENPHGVSALSGVLGTIQLLQNYHLEIHL
jgi:hypothetical protein